MEIEPVDTAYPLEVTLIALAVFRNRDGARVVLRADAPIRGDNS